VHKFRGSFVNDVMDGKCEVVYADGSRFEGAFRDGRRDGRGTYTFSPGGETYQGKWQADAMVAAASIDPLSGSVFMARTAVISDDVVMIPISESDLKVSHLRAGFDRAGL
jgi:hypothetical protein